MGAAARAVPTIVPPSVRGRDEAYADDEEEEEAEEEDEEDEEEDEDEDEEERKRKTKTKRTKTTRRMRKVARRIAVHSPLSGETSSPR